MALFTLTAIMIAYFITTFSVLNRNNITSSGEVGGNGCPAVIHYFSILKECFSQLFFWGEIANIFPYLVHLTL